MDTSKEYVLMCGQAKEIQDYFSDIDNRMNDATPYFQYCGEGISWRIREHFGIDYCCEHPSEHTKIVWLPYQYQLQRMVGKIKPSDWYNTEYTVWDNGVLGWQRFNTGEQLWLAFVMYEKYNKIWEQGKWVNKKC